jgi:hypothetical protein
LSFRAAFGGEESAGVAKQQIPRAIVPRFGMTILEEVFMRTASEWKKTLRTLPSSVL